MALSPRATWQSWSATRAAQEASEVPDWAVDSSRAPVVPPGADAICDWAPSHRRIVKTVSGRLITR
eukprot:364168-Prorocentrum_minimum.AAC.1